ncbi:MAG: PD-(D/E)XK nuclease family protein [Pirellulaceae bacterium]
MGLQLVMPVHKSKPIFLGWDKPLLYSATDWLWQTYPADAVWDLSRVTIVLPGRRAVRQFATELRDRALQHGLEFRQPRILTIGNLAERLYEPTLPSAGELEQTLAWCGALRSTPPILLTSLIAVPPPLYPVSPWLELAGAVRRLHEELASEHYTFGDIAEHLAKESAQEADRWRMLHELTQTYTETLSAAGLSDPYLQRRMAADSGKCHADGDVIVIGAVDLNKSIRSMLRCVRERVTILVGAPESEASAFDSDGCVLSQKWADRTIEIDDEQLVPAGDVEDLAIVATQNVSRWRSDYTIDQITVGITDEAMIAPLAEQLAMSDVDIHAEIGEPLLGTAPARLIALIVDYLQSRNFESFSALVRHADVYHCIERWLRESESEASSGSDVRSPSKSANDKHWMISLDRLRSEHFPLRVDEPLPIAAEDGESVRRTIDVVDRWLGPLFPPRVTRNDASAKRKAKQLSAARATGANAADDPSNSDALISLSDWCGSIREVLAQVYDHRRESLSPGQQSRLTSALATIDAVLARLSQVPQDLQFAMPGSTIAETLVAQLAEIRIHEPSSADKLEVVGWLDLSLDLSPALCVVGLNEPFVPESVVADPFLPGELRRRLKIADNDQRFARDAYALTAVLHSRPDVRILVGRSSADGSPTPPSRLLAACSPQTAAHRIRRLLAELPAREVPANVWTQGADTTELPLPDVRDYRPPGILSVTAFGDYLRCPYRFYLRHIAKLRPLDDRATEMAANQFGNLVHDSLETFGKKGRNTQRASSRLKPTCSTRRPTLRSNDLVRALRLPCGFKSPGPCSD